MMIAANRSTEMRLGGIGLRVFTVAGWNRTLRAAGEAVGRWWLATYMPLRFNTGYAMGQLGYRPKGRNRTRVMTQGEPPYVETGMMASQAGTRSSVHAVAKGGRASFWVRVAVGHPLQPHVVRSFKTIPPGEARGIARTFRELLVLALRRGAVAAEARERAKAQISAHRAAVRADLAAARRRRRQRSRPVTA